MDLSNPAALLVFHDLAVSDAQWPEQSFTTDDAVMSAIIDNHRCNIRLWAAEDQARRRDRPDAYIVQCKRQIDRENQQRNDAIERLDEALLALLTPHPQAPLHSETPGAIVDRLSILSLKIFHMGKQAGRVDADDEHRAACQAKWQRLLLQREDLAACLARLWMGVLRGELGFRVYRQFKMYNDPALNPWLRAGEKDAGSWPAPG